MDDAFFDGVKIEEVQISTGAKIGLPVRYYDWSAIMAHFPVPASKVASLLPSQRLKPALLMPGTAVITLTAFEYRSIAGVAPYNEFSVAVPVLYEPGLVLPGLPLLFPERFRHFGLYVHHLPVTTEEARVFGIDIWGYPKFVADISFEDTGQAQRCHLRAAGKDIITLQVQKMPTKRGRQFYYSYTVKDGQLLRTPIQVQGEFGQASLGGGASCVLGDHPIADELRALGMRTSAIGRTYAPKLQSLLHAAAERLPT